MSQLKQWWKKLSGREQSAVGVAALAVLLGLLWQVGIRPAWQDIQRAAALHAQADLTLEEVQRLAAAAKLAQQIPPLAVEVAARSLESSTKDLLGSSARLSISGERATVVLDKASADGVALWLARSRTESRAFPIEAKLERAGGNGGWTGTVVLVLHTKP